MRHDISNRKKGYDCFNNFASDAGFAWNAESSDFLAYFGEGKVAQRPLFVLLGGYRDPLTTKATKSTKNTKKK
jgi:hypothetical protein